MSEPSRIVVFRIGQLGDTVVALPAHWAVRRSFPAAHLALLCDRQVGTPHVIAPDLLEGAGLFDEFIVYDVDDSPTGRLLRPLQRLGLLTRLRLRRFDTLVYLAPSIRSPRQRARDRLFFALAGIRRRLGFAGFQELPRKVAGRPLPPVPREADLLLRRLAASGITVPPEGRGSMDLRLGERDGRPVDDWIVRSSPDAGRTWIGVGPGSKMPAKVWPEERFRRVVQALIEEHDVWPVTFGGLEDRETGDRLILSWGRGHNAAGLLGLRATAVALGRCALYLGNDTGPMHLAAAVGTPCVAVFSSRDWPGAWAPYGEGHRVFRTEIDCDGCLLLDCVDRRMECIRAITAEQVLEACRRTLARQDSRGYPFQNG
jgi:ADP-heptose:LPS heptosyltransferase